MKTTKQQGMRRTKPLPADAREYAIRFNTDGGKVRALKVIVFEENVAPTETVAINLGDDKVYTDIVGYVMNNMANGGTA